MSATAKYGFIPFILVLTMAGAELATDMYLPSLYDIERIFKSNSEITNLTLSMNLLGIAVSRPFYGFLCDCYGRRWVMFAGAVILCVSSLACAFAPTIGWLIAFRFCQGIGEAVGWVVGIAIMRDVYPERERYTQVMSAMRTVMAVFPAIGPIIGAQISDRYGWAAVFVFMGGVALVIVLSIFFKLPETQKPENRHVFSGRTVLHNYGKIFKNRHFMCNALISALCLAGLWVFIAASNEMYVQKFGFTNDQYSYFLVAGIAFYFVGSTYIRFMNKRLSTEKFLEQGLIGLLVTTVAWVIYVCLFPESPYMIRFFAGVFMGLLPLAFTATAIKSMEQFPSMSGLASAALGTLELVVASIFAALMGNFLDDYSIQACAALNLVVILLSCLIYWFGEKKPAMKAA